MTRLSCPFCWIYFFFIDLRAQSCPVAFFLTSTTLAYEPLPMTERRAQSQSGEISYITNNIKQQQPLYFNSLILIDTLYFQPLHPGLVGFRPPSTFSIQFMTNPIIMERQGIYATEVEPSSSEAFRRFKQGLDQRIRKAVASRKDHQARQSAQLRQQLLRIRQKTGSYRGRLQTVEGQFKESVEKVIGKDIQQQRDYQLFFKGHFEHLENQIGKLRIHNKQLRTLIRNKAQILREKEAPRQNQRTLTRLTQRIKTLPNQGSGEESCIRNSQPTKVHTLQSSLVYSRRLKTDSSLPLLRQKGTQSGRSSRAGSYMQPIGAVRMREGSLLGDLGSLLEWYRGQVDPESNWFLKVLLNQRNYTRLQDYIRRHSGSRSITFRP